MKYANIKITFLLLLLSAGFYSARAQKANWQNLDLKSDSVFGISTEKAYAELLKNKRAQTVVVAVIDGGVDIAHEDLKPVIWNNPGKDKDYPNDLHGWNFIGSDKGNVSYDNLELTRLVRQGASRFAGKDSAAILAGDMPAFRTWRQEKTLLEQKISEAGANVDGITRFRHLLDTIVSRIGKGHPGYADFRDYHSRDAVEEHVRKVLEQQMQQGQDLETFEKEQIQGGLDHYREELDYQLNVNYDPRVLVGDDYTNSKEQSYGNADVTGPDAHHGTHVAGIIAAVRDNDLGIKGVADKVLIMGVRAVPNGDERDKDVANAILYAADHGAKVINMSFGKEYSFDKQAVDEAVKYAQSKDILIVHAAGNDNKDLDRLTNYPNRNYEKGGIAGAWIEVGASGWKDDETLKGSFSNYGKTTVDVFAPGVQISSSIPGSKYAAFDGTSMAAPVVAGLAALIREYYPKLTAVQVKDVIMRSVVPVTHDVVIDEGDNKSSKRPFSDLCISGGIVNAYRALQLAEKYNTI